MSSTESPQKSDPKLAFSVISLFPDIFAPYLSSSIVGRGLKQGLIEFNPISLRDFGIGSYKQVDDTPFGGGVGMVLRADVLHAAWSSALAQKNLSLEDRGTKFKTVYLSPQGRLLTASLAKELSAVPNLILVSGHYEGIDERFIETCVDEEVSIGDYVLTGGELPALVLMDAVSRFVPGVVGRTGSVEQDSFEGGFLKYPQFTRPPEFLGQKVPDVLLSGDHKKIEKWRDSERVKRTAQRRPELISIKPKA